MVLKWNVNSMGAMVTINSKHNMFTTIMLNYNSKNRSQYKMFMVKEKAN